MASGRVLEGDWKVKKGVRVGLPEGGTWRDWGAPVPTMPISLVPPRTASEVAPSCPSPQGPRGHPIQTLASWGTLHVRRSRSSWKQLSSTHPSWYVQRCGEPRVGIGPSGHPRPGGVGLVWSGHSQ